MRLRSKPPPSYSAPKRLRGDGRTTALAVAKEPGIDEVVAEIFPEDKAKIVQRLRSEGRVVAMAGDGVNDAPALAAAEVGIAMGTGTDVAMESSGIRLLKGDLMGIVRARRLSHATMKTSGRTCFCPSPTTWPASLWLPASCIRSLECCPRP